MSVRTTSLPGQSPDTRHTPHSLTILPTYRCTAACAECCFESNPHTPGRLSLGEITHQIDAAKDEFPELRLVVFSGGECFMIGSDLDAAISHAAQRGLAVRCVSNGYWAVSEAAALKRLSALKSVGLSEINLSTGDEHQQFVPYERVVNAAVSSAALALPVLIVVEGHADASFQVANALADPRIGHVLRHPVHSTHLSIRRNVWMSFHHDRPIGHVSNDTPANGGCTNIFDNVVVTPHNMLASCCGLTMEHIPSLKLGNLSENSLGALYRLQFTDFLKIWIWVDGPHEILRFAAAVEPTLQRSDERDHPCDVCATVHLSPDVMAALLAHYHDKVPDVLARYELKRQLRQRSLALIEHDTPLQ